MKRIIISLVIAVILISCQGNKKNKAKAVLNKEINTTTNISVKEYTTSSGMKFVLHINHSMGASICDVKVETQNFTNSNAIYELGTIDPVTNVFMADLDKNSFEEIYIVTTSAGSGSYSTIYGFSSNKDKSVTPIYVSEMATKLFEKGNLFEGYRGHNTFKVENEALINSFPTYKSSDSNSSPTGGERHVSYKLVPGEAGWILNPDKVIQPK